MKMSTVFLSVPLGFVLAASNGYCDTVTITKAEDIHLVNQEGIIGAIKDPNNGASKRLGIARFLC